MRIFLIICDGTQQREFGPIESLEAFQAAHLAELTSLFSESTSRNFVVSVHTGTSTVLVVEFTRFVDLEVLVQMALFLGRGLKPGADG